MPGVSVAMGSAGIVNRTSHVIMVMRFHPALWYACGEPCCSLRRISSALLGSLTLRCGEEIDACGCGCHHSVGLSWRAVLRKEALPG